MADRKVKKLIPEVNGTTDAEKAAQRQQQSETKASIYLGPNGEKLFAGRVYELPEEFAAMLVARKGWSYIGSDGQPTDEKSSWIDTRVHPGTAEWAEKYGDRTVHDVMLEEKLAEAKATEGSADQPNTRRSRRVAASEPPAVE
jgi:hypothetical protein